MTSLKDKDLNDVLNNLFGPQPSNQPAPNNGGWKDANIDLSGMIPRTINQPLMGPGIPQNVPQYTPKQEPNSPSTVYLREGIKSYRKLEIDGPMPVAIEIGPIANVVGKEFQYCGKIKVYLAESMHKPIDLSNVDHSRMINLVIVRAPFQGTMLVPESAIIKSGNAGQQILRG